MGVGEGHTCSLISDGTVRCWGRGDRGQLGDGSNMGKNTPSTVVEGGTREPLEGAVQMNAGKNHTCALMDDGSARCWGAGDLGQLGDGTPLDRNTPVAVLGEDQTLEGISRLSSGEDHTCALMEDGTVRCWGSGTLTAERERFGMEEVLQVGAGREITCVILANGEVTCKGRSERSPADLKGIPPGNEIVVKMDVWGERICFLMADGNVGCR